MKNTLTSCEHEIEKMVFCSYPQAVSRINDFLL